jgi:ubiquinone/menaquinone biosynthesis C-methylase UbiE
MSAVIKAPADAWLDVRDRCLGPVLLSPFAGDLAARIARIGSGSILEIAADTGALTQAIAAAVSASTSIVATDPSATLLARAAEKHGTARVSWQTADPCALPFGAATFGVVVSQFGMAAVADRRLAFGEVRRVLRPGGRFIFSTPGVLRSNPAAACVQNAIAALFPVNPPSYLPAVLHGYADNETIDEDLTGAGFTDAVYTATELPYYAASAAEVARGYCLGTDLRTEIEQQPGGDLAAAVDAVTHALKQQFGSGAIETTMRAHIIVASG